MQAFRWSEDNAALAVWMLTSGLPWVLEWPCWIVFEDLESRGEKVQAARWIAARAVTSKGEDRSAAAARLSIVTKKRDSEFGRSAQMDNRQ